MDRFNTESKEKTSGIDGYTRRILEDTLCVGWGGLPDIELDQGLVQSLRSFAQHLNTQQKLAVLEIQHLELLTQDFCVEGDRLEELLGFVGITKTSLSEPARQRVELSASVAAGLKVRRPSLDQILVAMTDLALRRIKAAEQKKIWKKAAQSNHKIAAMARQRKSELSLVGSEIGGGSQDDDLRLPIDPEGKISQYNKDTEHYKSCLKRKNYKEEMSHHNLISRIRQLDAKSQEVCKLRAKLADYDQTLPRDLSAASVMLSNAKAELAKVADQIKSKMADG